MGRKEENTDFLCVVCERYVTCVQYGSYRNHCPFCLSSLHVDKAMPGDRKSSCFGIMQAYRLHFNTKKGWQIVHKCMKCGVEKLNKIVEGDLQSDNWSLLVKLSKKTNLN